MTAPATSEGLVVTRDGAILTLRLNRPGARNSLTRSVMLEMGETLESAEVDSSIRAVVLTGTGDRAFCAGMDLSEFTAGESAGPDDDDPRWLAFQRLTRGEMEIPVIAAANGAAVGGGLELLLGCDVVVAAEGARFALPEVKRGLFASGGGTFLASRIPLAVALEIALTGDFIDAGRAYELGLVNHVVAADAVLSTAVDLAGRIARNGPLALRATKEMVRLSSSDMAKARERYSAWLSVVFDSEDAREGAASFLEKRDPVWQGR